MKRRTRKVSRAKGFERKESKTASAKCLRLMGRLSAVFIEFSHLVAIKLHPITVWLDDVVAPRGPLHHRTLARRLAWPSKRPRHHRMGHALLNFSVGDRLTHQRTPIGMLRDSGFQTKR